MHCLPDSKKGFTLIEMLVVLTIVGILSAVGIHQLSPRSKPLVRQLTEQMFLVLNEGRQLARSSGRNVVLHTNGTIGDVLRIDLECANNGPNTPPPLSFSMNGQPRRLRDNAVPGIGINQIITVQDTLNGIKELGLLQDFDHFFVTGNNLFQGEESTKFSFSSAGQINQSLFITIGHPTSPQNNAFGLIILTPTNGVHAFFRGGIGESWKRI